MEAEGRAAGKGVGVESSPSLPGPFAVGRYARKLQEELRARARVLLIGEVTGVSRSKVQAYFELRDGEGAVPCAIWLKDLERAGVPDRALRDGAEVVIAGGPDYYPGGAQSSPSFAFRATHVRLAGEGDLLARLAALRKQLESEGLFALQKQLRRPLLPKAIGVVTAESGAARRDLLAGLARRGWAGTIVWAYAPVQDRRAAPAISAAIRELAARPQVEAIVVARGGGSLADLWAFCDETLCRTVAMLRVPVISAVGHDRDKTLIDDVAALACSTPTHAAEAVVPLDCALARSRLSRSALALQRARENAVGVRARHLAALARGPARALQRGRDSLNQQTREVRAASERGLAERGSYLRRLVLTVLGRARRRAIEEAAAAATVSRHHGMAIERASAATLRRHREALGTITVALRAHDPDRTLERGYALAETMAGEPVTRVTEARAADRISLRFADGRIQLQPSHGDQEKREQDQR